MDRCSPMTHTQEAIQKAMEALEPFAALPLSRDDAYKYDAEYEGDFIVMVDANINAVHVRRARTAHVLLSKCLEDGADKPTAAPDRIDLDRNGNLDDVVLSNVETFRLEYMNNRSIWIRCYRRGADDVVIWLNSHKKIEGRHDLEPSALPASPQSPAQVPTVEEVARVIDPEAFGLPENLFGYDYLTDRDMARKKGEAVIALFHPEKR